MLILGVVLGAWITTPAMAARTYFGFQIGVSNAPPPPRVYFEDPPQVVFVPESRVYVVDDDCDYDMFRYGRFWYVVQDGYWYRSRSYRGPFLVVDARYVPRPIYYVPAEHWRHRDWDDEGEHHGRKHHGRGHDDDQD